MQKQGKVIVRRVSRGSKSERDAVCLVTSDGEMVLRRKGGNPFHDPTLLELEGKTIRATGFEKGQTFFITDWDVVL